MHRLSLCLPVALRGMPEPFAHRGHLRNIIRFHVHRVHCLVEEDSQAMRLKERGISFRTDQGDELKPNSMSTAPAASLCAGHVQPLGGASPLPDLMEVRVSNNARATVARRGLKEAWSKCASRWTKIGYKARA